MGYKLQTEGPTAIKQQRLAHISGSKPADAKPEPNAVGTETEELTPGVDGQPEITPELPLSKQLPTVPSSPAQQPPATESFWNILVDTFKDPGGRLAVSFTNIHHLVWDGRVATPQESTDARRIGGLFNVPMQFVVPGLGVAGGLASTVDLVQKAEHGEGLDPGGLSDALPMLRIGPEPALGNPGTAGPSAKPKQPAFNPPTRTADGRIGYKLSPDGAPHLPKGAAQHETQAGHDPGPSTRADAGAGAGATQAGGAQATGQPQGPVPPGGGSQLVHRQDASGRVLFKEFAREETYWRLANGADGQPLYTQVSALTDGYTSNYRGKGLEAVVLHGMVARGGDQPRLYYQRGRETTVLNESQPAFSLKMDLEREVTPAELVRYLQQDQQLDLVAPSRGGTGRSDPLYLLACYATRGGSGSLAQQLADVTGREVRAHSSYPIIAPDPQPLAMHANVPITGERNPFWQLIRLRNQLRTNAQHASQLVHQKFQPRSGTGAGAGQPPSGPVSPQQLPRQTHSTFTPTQPSTPEPGTESFTPSPPSSPAPSPIPTESKIVDEGGRANFFDHVPPPPPPTHPVVVQDLAPPQQAASIGGSPGSSVQASGGPSSWSFSSFFDDVPPPALPSQPPSAPRPDPFSLLSGNDVEETAV